MKYFLIACFLISGISVINGQIPSKVNSSKIGDLQELLPEAQGTGKVDILNSMSLNLAPLYMDSCHHYANRALELAKELEYERGIGSALFNLGNGYFFRMDLENAYKNYLLAENILESIDLSIELGNLYLQLGLINNYVFSSYSMIRDEPRSPLYYYQKATDVFRMLGNTNAEYYARRMDAKNHDNPDTILHLLHQINDHYSQSDDVYYKFTSLIDLSYEYFHGKRDSLCLKYGVKALEAARETGDNLYISLALHKIVNYYDNWGDFPMLKTDKELARKYLLEATELLNNVTPRAFHYYLLAEGYRELVGNSEITGKRDEMSYFAFEGLKATELFFSTYYTLQYDNVYDRIFYYEQALGNRMMLYHALERYYSWINDHEKMEEYSIKKDKASNYLDRSNLAMMLNLLQIKHESDLHDQESILLENENERKSLQLTRTRLILVILGGSSLFLILFLIYYFQRMRLKSTLRILETEHMLLRSQMNPHFLFNMITSIQNFIVTQKPDQASLFLSKFSKLVRNILDNSSEEFISLEREIETLEHYLELQKNRYKEMFEYSISADDKLDEFNTQIPAMMLQPFIENAIEHGLKHKKTKGEISIRFIQKDEDILIEVEDNGIGRRESFEIEQKSRLLNDHLSKATDLIQARINVLNKKYRTDIRFEIIDLENDAGEANGTLVRIILPSFQK